MNVKRLLLSLTQALLIPAIAGLNALSNQAYAQTLSQQEAENANYTGGAAFESEHTGFSGSGYLGGFTDSNKGNAVVNFALNVPQAGVYSLDTRYANATGSSKSLSLYVDNQYIQQLNFGNGSNWGDWLNQANTMNLSAGDHMISLRFDNQDSGNVNLDSFTISSQTAPSTPVLIVNQQLELEQAALTGGAVVDTSHAGYSGSGFVGGYIDSHKGQARSQFNVDVTQAGMYELELRYANGTGSVRTLSLVTDQNSEQISLPATANWNSWTSFAHTVYLDVGSHSLSYLFANSDSGNINLDTVGLTQVTSTDPGPDPSEPPVVNPVDGNYYEAENAFLSGGAYLSTSILGYQGTGVAVQSAQISSRIITTVNAAQSGAQTVTFRYQNNTGSTQHANLLIDGIAAGELTFESTTGFTDKAYSLNLKKASEH